MKKLLLFLSVILFSLTIYSQNKYWSKISEDKIKLQPKVERGSVPNKYELFTLNLNALKTELLSAPKVFSGIDSNVIVSFPNPNGGFNRYKIYNNPVTEESYAISHPDVNTYSGQDIDDPTSSIRFSITMYGLNAMVFTNKDTYYIDTYTKDLGNYIVYFKKNLTTNKHFECSTVNDRTASRITDTDVSLSTLQMNDGNYRTYKLAISCTNEFSTYHITAAGLGTGTNTQKKEAVYQALIVGLTRVNGIYERELSVHLNLIYNLDIIYITSSDPYNNNNDDRNLVGPVLNTSSSDNNFNPVGIANYDIGHVFTTGSGMGSVGSICDNTRKHRGTTGAEAPVGDPFYVDYVCHEFGHQFGADHTFASTSGVSCTTSTINNETAVEPGSGSTIMGYAGICSPVDVQDNSDDYFHTVSLAQIQAIILATNCAAQSTNNNNAPVVNAGVDYSIPKSTPFMLTGSATDTNGDALTYCWEQIDYSDAEGSPYFRSFLPTTSPTRYFPSLNYVFQGNLTSPWERSPTYSRNMNFALTVRDNRSPNGGQTGRDDVKIIVDDTKGPLTVTSQNIVGLSYNIGTNQTVNWTVNNTNTLTGGANVNILLTIDNGATWTTLVANTPNDGSEVITLPNTPAQQCRIMVKATGNIFFNVNLKDFSIGYELLNNCVTYSNNTVLQVPDSSTLANSTINFPNSGVITDVNAVVSATHNNGSIAVFLVKLTHPNGTNVSTLWDNYCSNDFQANFNVTFDDSATYSLSSNCSSPPIGTYKPKTVLSTFNGLMSNGDWKLSAEDYWDDGDLGQINSWSITICYNYYALKKDSFGLENFAIYPNPNKGEFIVKFNSNSNNSVNIYVHDIRGRKVFNNIYSNNSVFQQVINLEGIQAGIYLVTVVDGNKKEVRKIIIE